MKSGLIVYSEKDAEKNTWFIQRCIEKLAGNGIALTYCEENVVFSILKKHRVDFVVYRSRNYQTVKKLESMGIRCFNSSLVNRLANNKYLSYQFFISQNIPCLKTHLSYDRLEYPFVMKSVNGHGGQEVFLINSEDDIKRNQLAGKSYVFQKFYKNEGDLRVYMLGRKVIGAVLRSNSNDFRSNFSLGGEIEAYEPDKVVVELATKVATLLDADYIGVDFMKINGQWIVNEIEDPVGARMLYKACNIDVVSLLADYIFATPNDKSKF